MDMKLLVINGPNMDMLGIREKEKYGNLDLETLSDEVLKYGRTLDVSIEFFQSNIEGEIINSIHKAYDKYDGIIINPAAYTHYSIAILDALNCISLPCVEVHMTNIFAREEYRKKSVTSAGCIGVIAGFGSESYIIAVKALCSYINDRR